MNSDVDIDLILKLIWDMESFVDDKEKFPDGDYLLHIFDDVSKQIRQLIPCDGTADTNNIRNSIDDLGNNFLEVSKQYSKARKEFRNSVLDMRVIIENLSTISSKLQS